MSPILLLDTGVLLAYLNTRDPQHRSAKDTMNAALDGRFGRIVANDYVLDELLTAILVRTGRRDLVDRAIELLLGVPERNIRAGIVHDHVTEGTVSSAAKLFTKYFDQELSFTDCVILARTKEEKDLLVATFDGRLGNLVTQPPSP